MPACFHNPVSTVFGAGSLARIAELCPGKVALVTFPEATQLGLVERVRDLLGERLVCVIDNVQPNPDVAWLRDVHERFWAEHGDCDSVFALGGGSAIDTAKQLSKLPLCAAALAEACEPSNEFHARRLQWAEAKLLSEGRALTRSALYHTASIRPVK